MTRVRVMRRHPARVIPDHPWPGQTRLMLIAADYPFMDVFWSILVFFLWLAWLLLLFRIFADIFRRHDIGGWGKAAWCIFVIFVPFLGVLVYLIAEGSNMSRRDMEQSAAARAEFEQYVRSVAATPGPTGTSGQVPPPTS
jgi:Phospholipase_D-nuclease N-terminal